MAPPDPAQRPKIAPRAAATTAAAPEGGAQEHIERLEVLARLEAEAARDDEARLWARIDREVLALVRRLLKPRAAEGGAAAPVATSPDPTAPPRKK
jgi:hypothetical protein